MENTSSSSRPLAKRVGIIFYVRKIWHWRFMPSFHLASANGCGHGLSWVIIYCVVARLNKVVLHQMSSSVTFHLNIFISLWNIGLLKPLHAIPAFQFEILSSVKLPWRKRSDSLWTLAPSCTIIVLFPQKTVSVIFWHLDFSFLSLRAPWLLQSHALVLGIAVL